MYTFLQFRFGEKLCTFLQFIRKRFLEWLKSIWYINNLYNITLNNFCSKKVIDYFFTILTNLQKKLRIPKIYNNKSPNQFITVLYIITNFNYSNFKSWESYKQLLKVFRHIWLIHWGNCEKSWFTMILYRYFCTFANGVCKTVYWQLKDGWETSENKLHREKSSGAGYNKEVGPI